MGSTSIPGATKSETIKEALAELGYIKAIHKVYDKRDRSTTIYTVCNSQRDGRPLIMVTIVEGSGRNWSWKHMDESSGPYSYGCPDTFFAIAGPPPNDWARRWRERCLATRRPELYPHMFYNASHMVGVRPSTSAIGYMVRGKFQPIPDLVDVMLVDGGWLTVTPSSVHYCRNAADESLDLMSGAVTERDARAYVAAHRG